MAKAPSTSLLSSLRISDEVEQKSVIGGVQKFIENIDKQIEYVNLEMKGEALPTKGGNERTLSPRLMYWKKKGNYYVTVRYGTTPVDLSGDKELLKVDNISLYSEKAKPTVLAGATLDEVKAVFDTIKKAVQETGELVPIIEHISSMISERLQRKR